MAIICYQLLCSQEADFKQSIKLAIQEGLSTTSLDFSEEQLEEIVALKYEHKLSNNHFLVGFHLDFDSSPEISQEFQTELSLIHDSLDNIEGVIAVFRFHDDALLQDIQRYVTELHHIEMGLREILTFIFLNQYPDSPFDLFQEVNIRLPNKEIKEKEMRQIQANQLFYLLFSDYIKANELKDLKNTDLLTIATIANDFDDFKNKIVKRGITDEKHLDFLLSIRQEMQSIETLRNCIAHNRKPTDDIVADYEASHDRLLHKMNEFWYQYPTNQPDPNNEGWYQGYGVYCSDPWHFVGLYETEEEAQSKAQEQGDNYSVAYGSNRKGSDDFVVSGSGVMATIGPDDALE